MDGFQWTANTAKIIYINNFKYMEHIYTFAYH